MVCFFRSRARTVTLTRRLQLTFLPPGHPAMESPHQDSRIGDLDVMEASYRELLRMAVNSMYNRVRYGMNK